MMATPLVMLGCTLACSPPEIVSTPAPSTPTPTPSASPTPSPSGSPTPTVVHVVKPTGAPGARVWQWTSEGPHAAYDLASDVLAVEKGAAGNWFVVRGDGRASALSITRGVQPSLQGDHFVIIAPSGPAAVREGGALLSVAWVTRDGVRSLRVQPVEAARGWITNTASEAMWHELVAAVPKADTPGMRDQLVCHMQFAAGKQGWFLEPDRPAVGYAATVAAACNPGNVTDGG